MIKASESSSIIFNLVIYIFNKLKQLRGENDEVNIPGCELFTRFWITQNN